MAFTRFGVKFLYINYKCNKDLNLYKQIGAKILHTEKQRYC